MARLACCHVPDEVKECIGQSYRLQNASKSIHMRQAFTVRPFGYDRRMGVIRLFPRCGAQMPLRGLYLSLHLQHQAAAGDVLIYANYIASVDGRISLWSEQKQTQEVPASLANSRDWRLYQELAAQSDIMITSARYFRQLAQGSAQDLLPVGHDDAFGDLRRWRDQQDMQPQPDVLILSDSLDIPLHVLPQDRRIWVLTGSDSDVTRRQLLEDAGAHVVCAEKTHVDGIFLRRQLILWGYRSAYMIAGPQVHHTLLTCGALDELFLTTRHCLLGGANFHTCLEGSLNTAMPLQLLSLYLDVEGDDVAQHYARYRLCRHRV